MFYNVLDVYAQVSIAEGDGMPIQEAKACGVPVLVTDYSALSEKGKIPNYEHVDQKNYSVHQGGEVIKLAYLYEEPETTCWRAHTSIEDCCHKMAALISDRERLAKMSKAARECTEENYNWDKNFKEWEFILDHITPLDRNTTWDKPIELIEIDNTMPAPECTDEDFVIWCYTKLLGYKGEHDIDEDGRKNWLSKLQLEASRGIPIQQTRQEIANYFRQQAEAQNVVERLRTNTKLTNTSEEVDILEAVIL